MPAWPRDRLDAYPSIPGPIRAGATWLGSEAARPGLHHDALRDGLGDGPPLAGFFFVRLLPLAIAPVDPQVDCMNTAVSRNLVLLARMLERLDRSTVAVDPQQYRGVVEHLGEVLR